jgi:GNAT superfamily N-acetyltransferase
VYPVQSLDAGDWDQWLPLWEGYLRFYRAALPEETTRNTFDRLVTGESEMFGLFARDERGAGVGLAHCVLHPTTWSRRPSCYLEDLYVATEARGGNVGRALLEEAKRESVGRGAERLYWHTQEYNGPARALYDLVGHPTSFIVYEM